MSKMGSHDPLRHLKHKLWPLKFYNLHDFFVCRWHAIYGWKDFDKGYNFALDFTSIEGMDTKLWTSKVVGISILRISGLQLGNPETKMTFGCWPHGQA
jgi:hypothetical protein